MFKLSFSAKRNLHVLQIPVQSQNEKHHKECKVPLQEAANIDEVLNHQKSDEGKQEKVTILFNLIAPLGAKSSPVWP